MTCRLGRESKQVLFPFVDCKEVAMNRPNPVSCVLFGAPVGNLMISVLA